MPSACGYAMICTFDHGSMPLKYRKSCHTGPMPMESTSEASQPIQQEGVRHRYYYYQDVEDLMIYIIIWQHTLYLNG